MTAWILVPPRSMPPRMARGYPPAPGQTHDAAFVARGRLYDGRVSADPFAVLGVAPGASGEEVAAAYRRLAKRWHPDHAGDQDAARRMAEINAAYDLVRSERWLERSGRTAPPAERPAAPSPPRAQAGGWLSAPLRRALGRELLGALEEGEEVAMVTPTSTWASPQALLAVTDRRPPVVRTRRTAERRSGRPRRCSTSATSR